MGLINNNPAKCEVSDDIQVINYVDEVFSIVSQGKNVNFEQTKAWGCWLEKWSALVNSCGSYQELVLSWFGVSFEECRVDRTGKDIQNRTN